MAKNALTPSTANRVRAGLILGLGVSSFMFVGGINLDALIDACGTGPPYYCRTTNMDKWENPLPILAIIDHIVLAP